MDSRQHFYSTAVLRVLETVGIISKEMPTIKQKQFQQNENIWAGKIIVDDSSYILIVYAELTEFKIVMSRMVTTINDEGFWHYVICGDETCNNIDLNKVLIETKFSTIDHNTNEPTDKIITTDISCYDLCDFIKGFEIIKRYMPKLETITLTNDIIDKVINVSKTLTIEETHE